MKTEKIKIKANSKHYWTTPPVEKKKICHYYSPSCCYKPVRASFIFGTQKKIFLMKWEVP